MESSKTTIIIVTYNAMKWAERCFSSLRKSTVPVQTIVVDNGSTDGTQDYIKTNFPEVEFIQSPENLGFGKANNIGIEKAYKNGADFFYLMNQDAWIFEDTFSELLNVYNSYENKEEIGILSPIHLDGTEKKLDIFIDKYIATNFENRLISDLYTNQLEDFYFIKFVNAAHWLLPKNTIEKVGGFNPYFFHYGEDNEYVNRVLFHKKKILLCPKSKAVHDGKQQLNKVDYNKFQDLTVETKILNPNIENALQQEKKSLRQSMLKNLFAGNTTQYIKLKKLYKKIVREEKTLSEITIKVKQIGASFLNLNI